MAANAPVALTKRQKAVLDLIARGNSNRAIGEQLGISENGVKNHVSRLLEKFDVPTRAALVGVAHAGAPQTDTVTPSEIVQLVCNSLAEVLGTTATETLVRRASKRAGLTGWNGVAPPPDTSMKTVGALVAALWPLLIEMTGNVMVGRLQAQGFSPLGDWTQRGGDGG